MMFGSRSGCVSRSLSSLRFQRNWKPGVCSADNEIFGSVRTDDVLCASPPTVVHAPPPRPCAETATAAPISAAAVQPKPVHLFLIRNLRSIIDSPSRSAGRRRRDVLLFFVEHVY